MGAYQCKGGIKRNCIGIPSTTKDTDKGKYPCDNESAEMLDVMHGGIMLDASWIYGSMMLGLPQIMRGLSLAGNTEYIYLHMIKMSADMKKL